MTERRPPKMLDVRNAAGRLGCTPAHVYTLIRDGELQAIKTGVRKGIRIDEDSLDSFLKVRTIDPDGYDE